MLVRRSKYNEVKELNQKLAAAARLQKAVLDALIQLLKEKEEFDPSKGLGQIVSDIIDDRDVVRNMLFEEQGTANQLRARVEMLEIELRGREASEVEDQLRTVRTALAPLVAAFETMEAVEPFGVPTMVAAVDRTTLTRLSEIARG